MKNDCITYHVNKDDQIIFISDEWQTFADENKAHDLTNSHVGNHSIYDFICNGETRHIYESVFSRCRVAKKTILIHFRCDAPDTRRFMEMTLSPLPDGGISIESCILREEKRATVNLLDRDTVRTNEILTLCSWCKKVRLEDQTWVEVEEAVENLKLFDKTELPRLSHGACDICFKEQLELLRKDNV